MNRNLRCIDCFETKWIHQNQWRKRMEKYGTGAKIKRNFRCRNCNTLLNNDPFGYYMRYGKPMKKIRASIRSFFREYRKTGDLVTLERSIHEILEENNIPTSDIRYDISPDGKRLHKIIIGNYPIIKELVIPLYSKRKSSY